jgi:hypothetical protein
MPWVLRSRSRRLGVGLYYALALKGTCDAIWSGTAAAGHGFVWASASALNLFVLAQAVLGLLKACVLTPAPGASRCMGGCVGAGQSAIMDSIAIGPTGLYI